MKAKTVTAATTCMTATCSATRYIPADGCTQTGTTQTADVSQCCEAISDTTKCGGLSSNPCTTATHFQDLTKAGATAGSTATEKATNCCTARGTCPTSGFCPAGMKLRTSPNKCAGATCVLTADQNTCCEADTTKCGGLSSNPCTTATHFRDLAKAGTAAGSTATDKATNCCTAKASCSSFTKKANVGSTSG